MADLVTFFRARLDEEEDVAKRAAFGWGPDWTLREDEADDSAYLVAEGSPRAAWSEDSDVIEHAATWDPSRVLAEVAAKRAILDADPASGARTFLDDTTRAALATWERAVLALAQPYADHPDFADAWRTT